MSTDRFIADRYELKGLLGRGGMGEVFLALDHRLQTPVALKRVPLALSLEEGIRDALIQEARIMARLSHSNIVRLFDLADTADGMFIVLEFISGPSFDKVLKARPILSPQEVLRLIEQVSQGLTLAHSRGIIHRDLKPSNLLLALEGQDQRHYERDGSHPKSLLEVNWKVTDFGLAKVVEHLASENISGRVVGTPLYMAPEQFRGEVASAETDIYALGLIAYQCLSGKLPTDGAEPAYFHMYVTPPPLPGVPATINAVLAKALQKDRHSRYPSVAAFAQAFADAVAAKPIPVAAPIAVPISVPVPQPTPTPSRLKYLLPLVLAGFFGGAIYLYQSIRDKAPTPAAPPPQAEAPEPSPQLPPLNPPPRIADLPPVIESARLKAPPAPHAIQKPGQLALLWIPGHKLLGIGGDGTAYFTRDGSNLSAVRDGKLIWAYELGSYHYRFGIGADGLIWYEDILNGSTLYCFNSAGQGGQIVASARTQLNLKSFPVPEMKPAEPRTSCRLPDASHDEPHLIGPPNKPWRIALDQPCNGDPIENPAGELLIQTKARTLYAISSEGKIRWTYSAPCPLRTLRLLSDGTAIGQCNEGKQLLGFKDGRQTFSRNWEQGLTSIAVVDSEAAFYTLERTGIFDQYRLLRINAAGQTLWSYPMKPGFNFNLELATDSRLYLTSTNNSGVRLWILGDSP